MFCSTHVSCCLLSPNRCTGVVTLAKAGSAPLPNAAWGAVTDYDVLVTDAPSDGGHPVPGAGAPHQAVHMPGSDTLDRSGADGDDYSSGKRGRPRVRGVASDILWMLQIKTFQAIVLQVGGGWHALEQEEGMHGDAVSDATDAHAVDAQAAVSSVSCGLMLQYEGCMCATIHDPLQISHHCHAHPSCHLQGIVGCFPWQAMVFFTLWLQLEGFSDIMASILVAMFGGGVALVSAVATQAQGCMMLLQTLQFVCVLCALDMHEHAQYVMSPSATLSDAAAASCTDPANLQHSSFISVPLFHVCLLFPCLCSGLAAWRLRGGPHGSTPPHQGPHPDRPVQRGVRHPPDCAAAQGAAQQRPRRPATGVRGCHVLNGPDVLLGGLGVQQPHFCRDRA